MRAGGFICFLFLILLSTLEDPLVYSLYNCGFLLVAFFDD